MRKAEFIALVVTTIVLAGCSKSSSGGGKNSGFGASDKIGGQLTPDIQSIENQPEAETQLKAWQDECRDVDGYKVPNLKAGMHFQTREDDISLWPDLKPSGEGRIIEQSVESVGSAKEFYSIQNQIAENYSIKARFRHTAGIGYYGSEMVSIISTNPPNLKGQIQKGHGETSDDNYVRCRSSMPEEFWWSKEMSSPTTYAAFIGATIL